MILNKSKSNRKDRGFTIVELLVVIVVIGILAAITIVAYTGFTARAKGSQTQANANSVQQVIAAYVGDQAGTPNFGGNGAFPANAGLAGALTAYPNTKLPAGVTVTAPPIANHPDSSDVDGATGIGTIWYLAKGTTGACLVYYNPGTSSVGTLFMGDAKTYTIATPACT